MTAPNVKAADVYSYTFYGCYDEDTHAQTAVNVTAYFLDNSTYKFELNGTSSKLFDSQPQFFRYDLGVYDREYWVESSDNASSLYVFNHTSLYTYTVQFNDLTNKLDEYEFVTLKSYVNGTLTVLDKRKVDVEKKVLMSAVVNYKYMLCIGAYTFGDLQFTSTNPVTLDIKGLEFPDNIQMGYRYVRCYAYRETNDSITAYYEDTLDETTSVTINMYYYNETLFYTMTAYNSSWTFNYGSADPEVGYIVKFVIDHERFGTLTYSQTIGNVVDNDAVFDLSSLGGDSLPFDVNMLIPMFIVLCCAGVFSSLNTWLGLGVTITVTWIVGALFGLPVTVDILIFCFGMAIIFGVVMLRRRTY